MASNRTKALEFSRKEREEIYVRDDYCCIFCKSTYALGVAHIFYSRAQGGLGVKENGTLACQVCHRKLDFGTKEERKKYHDQAERYLKSHYDIDLKNLKYRKW